MYHYYISYSFAGPEGIGHGSCEYRSKVVLDNWEKIDAARKRINETENFQNCVIISFQLLKTTKGRRRFR